MSSLEFLCAGLCSKASVSVLGVQGWGENDIVETHLLVEKSHIIAGSGASQANQFQCPVLTGDVVILLLSVYLVLPRDRRYYTWTLCTVRRTGEAERPYLQVKGELSL